MRHGAIVTAVLGGGTGLVFAAAVLAATLFPNGAMVAGRPNAWMSDGMAVPARGQPVVIDGGPWIVEQDGFAEGGIARPEEGPALPAPGAIVRLGG